MRPSDPMLHRPSQRRWQWIPQQLCGSHLQAEDVAFDDGGHWRTNNKSGDYWYHGKMETTISFSEHKFNEESCRVHLISQFLNSEAVPWLQ